MGFRLRMNRTTTSVVLVRRVDARVVATAAGQHPDLLAGSGVAPNRETRASSPRMVASRVRASEVKSCGASEQALEAVSIEAQSAAVAWAKASICNDERRLYRLGRTSGRGGMLRRRSVAGSIHCTSRPPVGPRAESVSPPVPLSR